MNLDNESSDFSGSVEGYSETVDDGLKEEKKNRKSGLLNWFKLRVNASYIILKCPNSVFGYEHKDLISFSYVCFMLFIK